ncbi:MAG: DUF4012 domain-containing protein [Candidatus Harrisonbacteria bacterium]|nr:DUF4012 domain-containing protein [Candidatus Harrisonbacteria bacterium]
MADEKNKLVRDVQPPLAKPETSAIQPAIAIKKGGGGISYRAPILAVLLFLASLYLVALFNFKNEITAAAATIKKEAVQIKNAALELKPDQIARSLENTYQKISRINDQAKIIGLIKLTSLLGRFSPPFAQVPAALDNLALLNEKGFLIAKDLDFLKRNGFQLMHRQKGEEVISALGRLSRNLENIENLNSRLKSQSFQLKNISSRLAYFSNLLDKNYLTINSNLYRAKNSVDAFLAILQQPQDQHFLLIFQNPSEIRPAGGFIGSYGDLTINRGNLKNIRIDDIYNADRQLNLKLIPPKELRGITKNWGARDANWFFDFPTSAKKVISLLEQSDLHRQTGIHFQGAIAVNTGVLKTLIEILGPIKLPNYELTLDGKNFLEEIQREVEAGRDKKPGQNPKKILSALAPLLLEKLNLLSDKEQEQLIAAFRNHLLKKDIMVYFRDWQLQNFLEIAGVGGEIINLPENFSGDYLAVINANIAGGKSDAFITQHIKLQTEITKDGKIANNLTITRTHSGQKEKDWWYRIPNKNYLKILTPLNSRLKNLRGNNDLPAIQKSSYPESYEQDPDLANIEKTASLIGQFQAWVGAEFGKTFFAAWLTVPAGQNKNLTVEYESGVRLNVQDGLHYQFIFEKQSGVDGSLEYSITAPPGYIWKESGKETFEYGTQKIKAREIISLTLTAI